MRLFVVYFAESWTKVLEVKKIRDLTMKKGGLSALHLSAASGIAVVGKYAFIVADDQLCMARFKMDSDEPGDWIRLFPGELPVEHLERKAKKPDLEAICLLPSNNFSHRSALLVVPSGSKKWRNKSCLLPVDADGNAAAAVLPLSFASLFEFLSTKVSKLNIEGVCLYGDKLLLVNRGNSKDGENAVFGLDLAKFLYQAYDTHEIGADVFLFVHHFDLGDVNKVSLSFTDLCVLPGDKIIYSAAAEATEDDYLDGPCAGSAVYIGDGKFQSLRKEILDTKLKVEGIYAKPGGTSAACELILVTDGDAEASVGSMLSCRLTL